jgi:hypothetical protein
LFFFGGGGAGLGFSTLTREAGRGAGFAAEAARDRSAGFTAVFLVRAAALVPWGSLSSGFAVLVAVAVAGPLMGGAGASMTGRTTVGTGMTPVAREGAPPELWGTAAAGLGSTAGGAAVTACVVTSMASAGS